MVFLPLISITGVTGRFFRALAITMTVSLLSSLALALTWTPTLSLYLVRRKDGEAQRGTGVTHDRRRCWPRRKRISRDFREDRRVLSARCVSILRAPCCCCAHRCHHRALYLCYHFLGSDLLPEMDEGGFILDYFTPPGSSLAESNRILCTSRKILHATPEVENTSRRTGLQLGLAAVTEANRGDFTVKLKATASARIDEIIADLRAQIEKAGTRG